MPPISAAEKQKLLLQQEIAKLSGAISRHATNPAPSHHHHHHPYARGSFRGSRGNSRGRGRGRGGSYGLDLRAANSAAKAGSSPALQPSSTSGIASPLPLASQSNAQAGPSRASPVKDIEKEAGEVSPSPSPKPKHAEVVPSAPVVEQNWVKGMSKRGNMSLMTEKKSNHLKSLPPKPKVKKSRIPAHVQVLSSASTSEGQRVVIDGVIFQFEQGGKKLARIGEVSPVTKTGTSPSEDTPTRRKLSYGGNDYRRTRGGNLVQSKRSKLATTPCRYFTKTGRCNRALTCPYAHNPDRLSICPKFLRGTCLNTLATCPLSHTPSPHNTPSCVHFQATQTCRNGSDCLYPHVKVADNAPICESFTQEGYCDVTPAGTCPKLHVWECGEWREKGTCSKAGKCGLRHVLRAEKGKQREAAVAGDVVTYEKDVTADGGIKSFEDGTAFINFDQGSPPVVSSEEEDGAEEDGDEDMEPHHVDQGHESGEEENASEDDGESGDSEEEDDDEGSEDDEDLVLDIVA